MPSEVPTGWVRRELGEIYRNRKEAGRPGLPVMSVTMNDGLVSRDSFDRRVASGLDPCEHLLARKGDLVYNTMRMWQGVSGVAAEDCVVSPAYVICQPTELIDSNFSGHLMKYDRLIRALRGHSQGLTSDRLRLYFHHFARVRICLPPLPEQKKIAAILSSVDEAIQAKRAVIEQTRRVKEGLLQDLLTKGIGQLGVLAEEPPHRWPIGRLGSRLSQIDAGWSPSCSDQRPMPGEWGVLKVSAATRGNFDPSESKRLPGDLPPKPALEVRDGDVICVRANGNAALVGATVRVEETPPRLMLSDKTLRLVPMKNSLDPVFLGYLMQSRAVRQQIDNGLAGSSGQKNISQEFIKSLRVPLPRISDQRRVGLILQSVDNTMSRAVSKVEGLRAVKAGLLQDLLTGKVRVSV